MTVQLHDQNGPRCQSTEEDFKLKSAIHNDAMVIEVNIAGWIIGKVLVHNGSSADI
jgi:hypothetical protein